MNRDPLIKLSHWEGLGSETMPVNMALIELDTIRDLFSTDVIQEELSLIHI